MDMESSWEGSVCMNSISLTVWTQWESRNEYHVSSSWNQCTNLSSARCLVSICPLPANLPQEGEHAWASHKGMQDGRLFIFDFINSLLHRIYGTTASYTAPSYKPTVRNTTQKLQD